MAFRVETTGYGAAASAALRNIIAEIKRDDPMAAATIIAPNNIAGIVARRHLAKGLTTAGPGVAGIEVTTLARLAERLAAPVLAPRRPATRPVLAAAWRRSLADDPGVFGDVADHPATVRALSDAHAELRDLSDSALRAVRSATSITPDLVALHEKVTGRVHASWYDTTDLLTTAAESILSSEVRKPLGSCVLYLPQDLTQAEARFARALADVGDVTVIVGLTGAKRADEAVLRTLTRLGVEAGPAPRIATAGQILNASDSDDEVRCVVREVVATLATTPAHRVAVLYAAASPYARLLQEHLAAAGIAVNGTGARATNERAVARTLLEVLALGDHDVQRGELFRALSNAATRDFASNRIPVSRWERISRNAGVVAGEDWASRLERYITNELTQAAEQEASEDPRRWLIDRSQRNVEVATQLRDFVCRLRGELQLAATMTSWRELAGWCLDLFTTLIGDATAMRRLPPEEQYAAAAIVSLLQGLPGLDEVDGSADLGMFREVLDLELAASLPRVGRFGDGVFVAPISAAIGLDLDVVFLVGLGEDLYPGRLREDPLLPERARDAAGGELASHRERLHSRYRHLLAAFASASDRVVAAFPRGDLRRSSRRLPSRWLLPSLRELSGDTELSATKWQQAQTYGARLATSGSYAGELLQTARLATEQEWRIRQASAARYLDDAVVVAGVEMIRARATDAFTRYDGNLTAVEGLPDYASGDRAVSPTALESYAGCPHGFFVERLLGVQALEQPEDIVEISPMEIGNLVHQSVDELVREFADHLPGHGQQWTREQRARLTAIADATAEQFQRRGLTGHPRLWERERLRILTDLAWLLDEDNQWRAALGARVIASEMPFGLNGNPPLAVTIPGGRVLMRGSADKVDLGADGTLYVTDIKTGSQRSFKNITQDDPLVAGTKLQLPVYGYAARERYGDRATPVHTTYWFVRRDRGRRGLDLTPAVEQSYSETLAVLVRSIARGYFPPRAPENPDFAWVQCEYCNPDGIGHADNRERWLRKRHDPTLRELVALIEPDALVEEAE